MTANNAARELVVESTRLVTAMLSDLDDTTWERAISPVDWDCRFTIEHIGGDFVHYAGEVAQQPTDHYVAFSFDQSRAKTHTELVETVEMAGLLLPPGGFVGTRVLRCGASLAALHAIAKSPIGFASTPAAL